MKKRLLISLLLFMSFAFIVESCKENGCSRALVSTYQAHETDKMTGDCMGCHSPNGGGTGCFRVGGTAFDSIPADSAVKNAIVKLYTQPNGGGELVVTLQVDKSGNFYTTSPVSFANGLYPAIVSGQGNIRYMPNATITGACNSCHGVVNNTIWAD